LLPLPLTPRGAAINDCALMSTPLPQHVDPMRYADAGFALVGDVAFKRLPRLSGMIANRDGAALIDLLFGIDEQWLQQENKQNDSEKKLICLRCLQPLLLPVAIE